VRDFVLTQFAIRLGYVTRDAANGAEALAHPAEAGHEFDLSSSPM